MSSIQKTKQNKRNIDILPELRVLLGRLRSLLAGGWMLPQIKLLALPTVPSVLILPFDAVYSLTYRLRPEE
jgi:hypothetical protein